MNKKIELFHDFNTLLESSIEGKSIAPFICNGTIEQIKNENIVLSEGQLVTLINPDDVDEQGNPDRLEVDAIVRFDAKHKIWVGEFESCKLKYRSEKQ